MGVSRGISLRNSLYSVTCKQIIENYPEDDYYAGASLDWLLFLEKFSGKDYESLRLYLEEQLQSLQKFDQLIYNLISQTYAQEENYEEALARFEAVINNPPSEAELVCAMIDEAYYYLKAQEQGGGKSSFSFCTMKPENYDEFYSMILNIREAPYDFVGHTQTTVVKLEAGQNYPNPFNPSTTISFSIPSASKVEFSIYNIKGQKVKTLINNKLAEGKHNITWNGTDDFGKLVSSGIYLYRINAGNQTEVMKMLLMK